MPISNKLTLVKEIEVDYTENLAEIITFLNKNLKKDHDILFGLRKNEDSAIISIYNSQAWSLEKY